MKAIWQALYETGLGIVLSGQEHNYPLRWPSRLRPSQPHVLAGSQDGGIVESQLGLFSTSCNSSCLIGFIIGKGVLALWA